MPSRRRDGRRRATRRHEGALTPAHVAALEVMTSMRLGDGRSIVIRFGPPFGSAVRADKTKACTGKLSNSPQHALITCVTRWEPHAATAISEHEPHIVQPRASSLRVPHIRVHVEESRSQLLNRLPAASPTGPERCSWMRLPRPEMPTLQDPQLDAMETSGIH